MAKKAAKKARSSKPAEATPKPRDISLRRPKEPTIAEVASAYFERDEHYRPLHTIGMNAEAVEALITDDITPPAVRMREAAKSIEGRAKQLDRFRSDIGSDDRLDVTSRFIERTKVQAQAVEGLEKQVNKAGQFVTDYVNDMGTKMQAAWGENSPESPLSPSEIRAHVTRLERSDRLAFIQSAIDNGDGSVVNSALSAPAYMLGIEAHDHERLMAAAHERFCPDAVAQRDQLLKAFDAFTRQAKAVIGAYTIGSADAGHYDRTQKALKDAQDRAAALAGE